MASGAQGHVRQLRPFVGVEAADDRIEPVGLVRQNDEHAERTHIIGQTDGPIERPRHQRGRAGAPHHRHRDLLLPRQIEVIVRGGGLAECRRPFGLEIDGVENDRRARRIQPIEYLLDLAFGLVLDPAIDVIEAGIVEDLGAVFVPQRAA